MKKAGKKTVQSKQPGNAGDLGKISPKSKAVGKASAVSTRSH